MFESIPDYKKIVLIMFLNKNDFDLLNEFGYVKIDNIRLCIEFKNT